MTEQQLNYERVQKIVDRLMPLLAEEEISFEEARLLFQLLEIAAARSAKLSKIK